MLSPITILRLALISDWSRSADRTAVIQPGGFMPSARATSGNRSCSQLMCVAFLKAAAQATGIDTMGGSVFATTISSRRRSNSSLMNTLM